ncbi:hypothetical protein [Agromyces bracchium]|uniref:Uncharacterized protein n=1 Tax=Agromyces bracchium TaxID=88376 RepID=A0A6I3MAW0_9MICO|nr:hypothetical protein [Agromyces bracchium]MTH67633.1 hypothetical protein [Agromyces bracchium]
MEIVIVVVGIAVGGLARILTPRDRRNSQGLDHAADASHAEATIVAFALGA